MQAAVQESRHASLTRLATALRAGLEPAKRVYRSLKAWHGLLRFEHLTRKAYARTPFQPLIEPTTFVCGPRQYDRSCEHYGHDIVLRRHAKLPLIGAALPVLVEHGLQFAQSVTYAPNHSKARAWICMGPRRAQLLTEQFDGMPTIAVGPFIHYARSRLSETRRQAVREALGPTLLVALAKGWEQHKRLNPLAQCEALVQRVQADFGYRSILLLRHWADPVWEDPPPSWRLVSNGHRSNPWFLDSFRTLLEVSDGFATNIVGTHLGYALAMGKRLHVLDAAPADQFVDMPEPLRQSQAIELQARQSLMRQITGLIDRGIKTGEKSLDQELIALLDPYWGFSCTRSPAALRDILLRGSTRSNGASIS